MSNSPKNKLSSKDEKSLTDEDEDEDNLCADAIELNLRDKVNIFSNESKLSSPGIKGQKLPFESTFPGLTSELAPATENLVQTVSNQLIMPKRRSSNNSNICDSNNPNIEDKAINELSVREHEQSTFRLFIPAIAKKDEEVKQRGFCCCCRKRGKRSSDLDVKQMKTFELWKWFLHRMLLAVQVINALKKVQKDIEIYGAMGESQTTLLQRRMSTLVKNEENQPKCILLPDSKFTWLWMLQIMLLLVWMAIYIPYRLAFLDVVSLEVFIMECIVDGIFLTDVVINFFTAYYDDKDNLVLDKKIIAKHYLKTWFTIDLLSSLPFQIFDSSISSHNKLIKLLRLPRIYKVIKVIKLTKMVDLMKSSIYEKIFMFVIKLHSGFIRLSKVMIIMEYFVHFYSCLWYYIAKFEGFQPDCWVVYHGILDASNTHKYLMSFYWVLQTVTSVGYGDMNIGNETERILAIILMIFGVGFYSYMIGNLSSIFSTLDTGQMKLNKKLFALNEFAAKVKMPTQLYFKIRRILERNAASSNFNLLDQETLLNELPAALKSEVTQHTHQKILNSFSFFKGKPPQFVADILPKFQHISLGTDEVIYRKGEWVQDTYFLLKGRVAFITTDGYIFRNYVNGSYFGEVEHFQELPSRLHSVLTMEETELLAIKTTELDNILLKYPDIKTELTTIANQRFHKNKDALLVAQRVGFKIDNDRIQLLKQGNGDNMYKDFYSNLKKNAFQTESDSENSSSQTDSESASSKYSSCDNKTVILDNKISTEYEKPPSTNHSKSSLKSSSTLKRYLKKINFSSNQESNGPKIDKKRIKYYKEDRANTEPAIYLHYEGNDLDIINKKCGTEEGKFQEEEKRIEESYIETETVIGEENKISENGNKGGVYDFEDVVHMKPYFHPILSNTGNPPTSKHLLPLDVSPIWRYNTDLCMIEESKESAESSPACFDYKQLNRHKYPEKYNNCSVRVPTVFKYKENTNTNTNIIRENSQVSDSSSSRSINKRPGSPIRLNTLSATNAHELAPPSRASISSNSSRKKRKTRVPSSKHITHGGVLNRGASQSRNIKRRSFAYFNRDDIKTKNLLQEAAAKYQIQALLKTNQGILRRLDTINNQRQAQKSTNPSTSASYLSTGLKWIK